MDRYNLFIFIVLLLFFSSFCYGAVPSNVIINEIMYNSAELDEEWIELYNNTSSIIVLDSSWVLTDGEYSYFFEGYTLNPGDYVTVEVFSTDSFPFTPDIDASSAGIQLSNTADQVVIRQGDLVIDSVEYYEWWGDMAHDGEGPSLERRHYFVAPDDETGWNSSTVYGGTPGAENSIFSSYGNERPVAYGLKRSVARPTSSDEVDIAVIAYDDLGLNFVELIYHTGSTPWSSLEMADDGAHTDREANDNIYGATIPEMPHGTQVYYFVIATDIDFSSDTTDTDHYLVNDSLAYGSQVVINEIMYNSIGADTEYVELYNREDDDIDISGWQIKDATENRYTFPEGTILEGYSYLVVCSDTIEIIERYDIFNVIGNVGYGLNNGTDKVLLFDEIGFLMDSVLYYDGGDWPDEADGNGPSLELIDPLLDNTLPESWAASEVMGGTPGAANSVEGIEDFITSIPENFVILRNYPNPFNSTATFEVKVNADYPHSKLAIFNLLGERIDVLHEGMLEAGTHWFKWDIDNMESVTSGVYFYRFRVGNKQLVGKLILIE